MATTTGHELMLGRLPGVALVLGSGATASDHELPGEVLLTSARLLFIPDELLRSVVGAPIGCCMASTAGQRHALVCCCMASTAGQWHALVDCYLVKTPQALQPSGSSVPHADPD